MAMIDGMMTLLDLRNSVQPVDGGIIDVAEVLVQENEAFTDIPWVAGNQLTSDVHFKRTVMPVAEVRKINEGVEPSISKKEAETDTCIEIASMSAVDLSELKLAPDPTALLSLEARPRIAVMGETVVQTMFYGNDAGGVVGFAPRYGKLNGKRKEQIVNFGGTGGSGSHLASVFIVKWDGREVTGIHPKNAPGGLQKEILEKAMVEDAKNKSFLAHVTYFSQFFGLKLRDDRFAARLCNIDMKALATDETARQRLFELLITAKNRIFHVTQGRVVMYVSPELFTMLEIAAFQKTNTIVGYKEGLTQDTRLLTFSGIPIRRNDFQSEPETEVA